VDGVGRIQDRASRLPAGPATQAPRARRRRREDDDYDDRSSEEAPQTRNAGLVIGLAVGGGLVVLAIAVTAILLIVNAASRQGEVVVKKPSKVEDRVFKPGPLPKFPVFPQPVGDKGGWRQFVSPNKDFSVLLPSEPNEVKQPLPAGAGVGVISVYLAIDPRTQMAYTLNAFDLPSAERNLTLENNLENFKAGLLAQLPGGKITREARVQVDGRPGMEFHIDMPTAVGKVTSVVRVSIAGGRIYSMSVAGTGITSATPDVASFFASFRIMAK
jgi:hypothetical protein